MNELGGYGCLGYCHPHIMSGRAHYIYIAAGLTFINEIDRCDEHDR